ncbi:uncharacterized protein LOC122004234 [Zingiber officinale]|uniref:Uncharacterized protein n=1 Tax=Zingiber officinale TaxID=94328 RepID=A0A8J5FL69_ZINOF|nr:uncharacterized protein LOC122004234 [Zingiber officinale]KAG6489188.1 hypothetical protein ZIOFF_050448 [Zingiber officinale]
MVSGSCTDEATFNVSAARLWKGVVCEPHILYPKLLPDIFSKAERANSNMPLGSFNKNKIEVFDEEYETLGDKHLTEEELKPIRDGSIGVLKAVEGYLLADPDVYA